MSFVVQNMRIGWEPSICTQEHKEGRRLAVGSEKHCYKGQACGLLPALLLCLPQATCLV